MFARGSAGERRGQRERLAVRTAWTALVCRGIAFVCVLARTGLALKHLGGDAFGLWMAVTAASGFLQFADLGIGNSLQNRLSAAHGRQEADAARDLFYAGTFWLLLLAGAAFLLGAVLVLLVPWAGVFGVHDPGLAGQIPPLLWVCLGAVCAGIPCSAPQRLAVALQQGWMAWVTSAGAGLLSVLALWIAVRAGCGPAGCAAWAAGPALLAGVGLGFWLVRRLGWGAGACGPGLLRRHGVLLREGFGFLFLQGAGLVGTSLPPVLLSAALGPAAVTPFTLATQMAQVLTQFQGAWLAPLWPAYAEAQAGGDDGWIRRTFGKSLGRSACLLPGCLLLPLCGGAAAHFLGADFGAVPGSALLWWTAVWTAGCILTAPVATLLNGLGRVSVQAAYAGLAAMVSALALLPLVRILGPAGAPAALGAGHLLVNLPLCYMEVWRHLESADPFRLLRAGLAWILRQGISRNPAHRPDLCIYKCDGYGDFVLATGAIRTVLRQYPEDRVLLVCFNAGSIFAGHEFPRMRRMVLPEPVLGKRLARFLVLLRQWALLRQVRPGALLCLRHQRTRMDDLALAILGKTTGNPAAAGSGQWAGVRINRELERHRVGLAAFFGKAPDGGEVLPRLESVHRWRGGHAVVSVFAGSKPDNLRNLPDWQVLEALGSLLQMGVARIFLTGLPVHEAHARELLRRGNVQEGRVEWVSPGCFLEFVRLVSGARMVFSTDSVAAHLACALDVPLVAILAGAHYGEFAPWGRPGRQVWLTHELPCFGCDWRCPYPVPECIRGIPPGDVARALESLGREV
jgi:O-antigen/teichoic acid export membrane protein/ADP-heptose:LPS heptosyltransferase